MSQHVTCQDRPTRVGRMDSTYDPTVSAAAAINDARNAARQEPSAGAEAAAASKKLAEVDAYLTNWADGIRPLIGVEPREDTTAELVRLVRLGRIVSGLISEASAHTAEALRISRQHFPEVDPNAD